MSGTIRHIDEADDLEIHGEHVRPLLSHLMGSPIEVCEQSGPKGSGPPPHHHPWDEIFLILEGALEVTIGDQQVRIMRSGSIAHVPGGTVHSFRNVSEHMRMLSITTEGRAVEMFTAVAHVPPAEYPDVGPPFRSDSLRRKRASTLAGLTPTHGRTSLPAGAAPAPSAARPPSTLARAGKTVRGCLGDAELR